MEMVVCTEWKWNCTKYGKTIGKQVLRSQFSLFVCALAILNETRRDGVGITYESVAKGKDEKKGASRNLSEELKRTNTLNMNENDHKSSMNTE